MDVEGPRPALWEPPEGFDDAARGCPAMQD